MSTVATDAGRAIQETDTLPVYSHEEALPFQTWDVLTVAATELRSRRWYRTGTAVLANVCESTVLSEAGQQEGEEDATQMKAKRREARLRRAARRRLWPRKEALKAAA